MQASTFTFCELYAMGPLVNGVLSPDDPLIEEIFLKFPYHLQLTSQKHNKWPCIFLYLFYKYLMSIYVPGSAFSTGNTMTKSQTILLRISLSSRDGGERKEWFPFSEMGVLIEIIIS